MSTNEQQLEKRLQDLKPTAPRLTPADIDKVIVGEAYHRFPGTTPTFCILTLRNDFWATGEKLSA